MAALTPSASNVSPCPSATACRRYLGSFPGWPSHRHAQSGTRQGVGEEGQAEHLARARGRESEGRQAPGDESREHGDVLGDGPVLCQGDGQREAVRVGGTGRDGERARRASPPGAAGAPQRPWSRSRGPEPRRSRHADAANRPARATPRPPRRSREPRGRPRPRPPPPSRGRPRPAGRPAPPPRAGRGPAPGPPRARARGAARGPARGGRRERPMSSTRLTDGSLMSTGILASGQREPEPRG